MYQAHSKQDASLSRYLIYHKTKRVFDLFLILLLLPLISPLMLLIAICIKLDSEGTVFYKQVRVGRYGKPFHLYKFRTMYIRSDNRLIQYLKNVDTHPVYKMANDPRITRIGSFLRRTTLDELPQLFNILNGDMSFVGPRPLVEAELVLLSDLTEKYLEVVPGMTGLWQIKSCDHISFEELVETNLWYIENWSLLLDFKILIATFISSIRGNTIY